MGRSDDQLSALLPPLSAGKHRIPRTGGCFMEQLRFQPGTGIADPDQRVLSDQDLEEAVEEGRQRDQANA
jgi:hypothetical protein